MKDKSEPKDGDVAANALAICAVGAFLVWVVAHILG